MGDGTRFTCGLRLSLRRHSKRCNGERMHQRIGEGRSAQYIGVLDFIGALVTDYIINLLWNTNVYWLYLRTIRKMSSCSARLIVLLDVNVSTCLQTASNRSDTNMTRSEKDDRFQKG